MKNGINKNLKQCTKSIIAKTNIETQRKEAKHGDFFFADFIINNGQIRHSPVFVVSDIINNDKDVIICSCTTKPARSEFDVSVKLKYDTHIRTNKIYTIHRDKLKFKIPNAILTPEDLKKVKSKLKIILNLM